MDSYLLNVAQKSVQIVILLLLLRMGKEGVE